MDCLYHIQQYVLPTSLILESCAFRSRPDTGDSRHAYDMDGQGYRNIPDCSGESELIMLCHWNVKELTRTALVVAKTVPRNISN